MPSTGDKARLAAAQLVGRERELDLVLSAVSAGCDIVLEGPPGTSKTTILRAIADSWGIPLLLVEGNADLSVAKLVGHHVPARVLSEGYTADTFEPGPLLEAMRRGGFLYIEEINRAPEDTLNALLSAIADRTIAVPRLGEVTAEPTFRVIASMNPYDNVGTNRLSASVHDRLCRLSVDYQDAAAEREIVALRAGAGTEAPLETRLAEDAVAIARATRRHPDLRMGSSVRGAIDTVRIARQLAGLRELADPADPRYPELLFDAIAVALSGRIQLDEAAEATPETILREIWEERFVLEPVAAAPG